MLAWSSAWGADLHIAQQMPLPLTISCSSKSRLVLSFLVLPFWYLLTRVDLDIFQTSSKTVVCCVCVYYRLDEDGKVLTPEEILYRVCIFCIFCFHMLHKSCSVPDHTTVWWMFIFCFFSSFFSPKRLTGMPSVLWHCWSGEEEENPALTKLNNEMLDCWCGYLSGAKCKWFAYGLADATATPSSLALLKSRIVLPFWHGLPRISWKRGR